MIASDPMGGRSRFEIILETVGEGVIGVDRTGTIVMSNREVDRIFGYARGQLVGQTVHQIMPQRHRAAHDAGFTRRLDDPREMPISYNEVEGLRKDGTEFPLEIRFSKAEIDGEIIFIGAMRDITERREAQHQIARLQRALEQERDYLREEVKVAGSFGDIIGDSDALRSVLDQVDAVAKTEATVLILGESGSGKELIARAIHERSARAGSALVKVNCASVPRELFESEFFGHRKGAFTGAVRDRVGRFQLAHGGTIFLDEVGEIPLELQSKLLRVLQEQELERVGDERTQKIDVRVVAATNRDLRKEAEMGRFREDLYYRLGVFPIAVPPLRARRDDIVPLARHFLSAAAERIRTPVPELPPNVATKLESYPWPGNVRELQNVMERAAILAAGSSVRAEMLYLAAPTLPPPSKRPSQRVDATAIREALEAHDHNIARVAKALGLSRQALYRRMDKLGIDRPARR